MATHREVRAERHRAYARNLNRLHRGIGIGIGLLAMLGGTRVRFPDLREAIVAWRPALFFVALGGYFLALGTTGFQGFKHGRSYRAFWAVRDHDD